MALATHRRPFLDIQDDTVTVVEGGLYWFGPGLASRLEEVAPVELVKPGQALRHLICMHSAAFEI